jgi:hypothetical protein
MHTAVKRPCLDDREVVAYVEGGHPPVVGWTLPELDAVRAHLDTCARWFGAMQRSPAALHVVPPGHTRPVQQGSPGRSRQPPTTSINPNTTSRNVMRAPVYRAERPNTAWAPC